MVPGQDEVCARGANLETRVIKTLHQQALASLHRLRSGWLSTRTARINAIRGLLRELGILIPQGPRHVLPRLAHALADPSCPVPESLHEDLLSAGRELSELDTKIRAVERQLKTLADTLPATARLMTVPGIGLLTSTALIGFVGDPSRFRSGGRFASYLGLVPRERSSGLQRHRGAITKRGDAYLRTLLIHGARSTLYAATRSRRPDRLRRWVIAVRQRRGNNRAAVALANNRALGQSDPGRRLFISFTVRKSLIRVISARDMTRREHQAYEQSKA